MRFNKPWGAGGMRTTRHKPCGSFPQGFGSIRDKRWFCLQFQSKRSLRSNSVICCMVKIISENPAPVLSKPEGHDSVLTKAQLAERLNTSARRLENWMEQRLVPYVKPTMTVRFIWPDVE